MFCVLIRPLPLFVVNAWVRLYAGSPRALFTDYYVVVVFYLSHSLSLSLAELGWRFKRMNQASVRLALQIAFFFLVFNLRREFHKILICSLYLLLW